MIICICRRINEKGVREAVRSGARCPDSVQAHHGQSFNCGKCRCAIGDLIAEEVETDLAAEAPLVAAE